MYGEPFAKMISLFKTVLYNIKNQYIYIYIFTLIFLPSILKKFIVCDFMLQYCCSFETLKLIYLSILLKHLSFLTSFPKLILKLAFTHLTLRCVKASFRAKFTLLLFNHRLLNKHFIFWQYVYSKRSIHLQK